MAGILTSVIYDKQDRERPDWALRLRRQAESCFAAGVEAADPKLAVRSAIEQREGRLALRCADGSFRSAAWPRIWVAALGKAALRMAEAVVPFLPEPLMNRSGIAVTNYENAGDLEGFEVIAAGHPLPDANGVRGAEAILSLAGKAQKGDLFLVLVSGGGSALVPAPAGNLQLEDKIRTTEILLSCGADIQEINTVRKHLSSIKGGFLTKQAAPADIHTLILSDVLGDDFSSVASGPTVPDPTRFEDSRNILDQRGAWKTVPRRVQERIKAGIAGHIEETPKPGDPVFTTGEANLIGGNWISLRALETRAREEGYKLQRRSDSLQGEAREEARIWAHDLQAGLKTASLPLAMSAGGETTVTLRGSGRGGRNQEFALAFALAAEEIDLPKCWLFLSGGTDGRDGPTKAAGGITDPWSLEEIRQAGIDPHAALANNDSHTALKACHGLLMTGATGTNVADLQIVLMSQG